MKIENNDIIIVKDLTKTLANEPILQKNCETVIMCVICGYPFKDSASLKVHANKHKKETTEVTVSQECGICGSEVSSNNELRKHIKIKHTQTFNCQDCDFQGSSNMILIKHTNLKHRTENEHEEGTLKCTECKDQFTSNWNLKNHKRDNHQKTKFCQHFKIGRCKFPDDECWDKHEKEEANERSNGSNDKMQCHTCRKSFTTKNDMMIHRIKEHNDMVMQRPRKLYSHHMLVLPQENSNY